MSTILSNASLIHNDHLDALEAESIYIIREVVAQAANPAMLFSGGKDSIVMFHLARKAFRLGQRAIQLPFPLLHIDTGHNYPEVIAFRDETVRQTGVRLVVAKKGIVELEAAKAAYEDLLTMGVSKEQARAVLPPAMYTSFVWTCSLQALLHFISLRKGAGAQGEIVAYADALLALGRPVASEAFEAFAANDYQF